ncbi:MAG: M20/M25/M40 family metallo-hydrolase [Methylobacteriaceae bacterium]|nr:M20/M25/M40 family metallo-hydrolase [Methylobacteriaceae bacterium]
MSQVPETIPRLRGAFDRDGAIALLRRAVGCESVTGNEREIAALLADELRALGASDVEVHDFLPGRGNAWGVRRGTGGGNGVLLIGHTDTVHVRGWRERWAGTERADPFGGAIVDGALWGRGAADLKGGLCAAIEAVRTLDRAGIALAGDVGFGFVGDEESGEPGSGVSAGMKDFARLIGDGRFPKPDFAIYLEPTTLDVYPAQMGFFICDLKITGRSAYFGVPEEGIDALKASHAVLSALWAHSRALAAQGSHPLVGASFLLVTAIAGGGYIAVPGECRLSLIRKLRPGEELDAARSVLEEAVRDTVLDPGINIEFAYPAGRDHRVGGTPSAVDPGHPAIIALAEAMRALRPDRGRIAGAPYWSEAPFLVALGIPTVYCAPGDIRVCHTLEERIEIDEYCDGTVALAAFLADYCNRLR